MPAALPIDALLPEIEARLRAQPNLVIQADPGAGKTTRVPPLLLERGLCEDGTIVVAQPRRLAARLAAQRVASERGEPVGQRVGYQVRFESRTSDATRLLFVTEGLLVRRLRDAPTLPGVAAVEEDRALSLAAVDWGDEPLDGAQWPLANTGGKDLSGVAGTPGALRLARAGAWTRAATVCHRRTKSTGLTSTASHFAARASRHISVRS